MKNKNKNQRINEQIISEKYDYYFNLNGTEILFLIFIIFTLIGTTMLFVEVNDFTNNLKNLNPNYPFPKLSDFSICFILVSIILFIKIIIESALQHFTEDLLDKKYLLGEQKKMRQIIKKKLATNIVKLFYYGLISLFSYFILKKCNYFPKELGGNGEMSKMFENGFPESFYHFKPKYFNLHYFINLSYALVDLISLIFLQDKQTDFYIMLCHHFCTISLIVFSYITNYSHVGSLVLFLHNSSDFIVYCSRCILYIQTPKIIKSITGPILLLTFLYMRIFILAKIIYCIYSEIQWKWGWITFSLWSFLIILYIMHVNWTCKMLIICYDAVFKGKFNDSCKFNAEVDKGIKDLKKF